MQRTCNPQAAMDQALREHVLVLGGLVALGRISDEVVWQLTHSLRASRLRALRMLKVPRSASQEHAVDSRPHPAIAQFLRSLSDEARNG